MTEALTTPTATQRTAWFIHDRFGMFIHWGLYALPARHEWVKNREKLTDEHYDRYFKHFDPDLYDPRVWARYAKEAGMRYAVITTKHHEGFCLWDTQLTAYKAPNTPAGRDLLREWVDAFRAEGLKIGFYHSLIDWHHPDFTLDGVHPQRDDLAYREQAKDRDMSNYRTYLHGQVRELLSNYGKIDVIWYDFSYPFFDWGWAKGKGKEDWHSEELVQLTRELQPEILINNRLDLDEEADFHTPEQFQPRNWITSQGQRVTWEACQTLNGSWGYDRDNLNWKSPELLVRMLIDSVSKGGNLLLNVGPTGRGEFDPRAVATLKTIGEWTRLHGRSIYGASASAYEAPTDCRLTQRGNRLYLHIFSWPMQNLYLDGLAGHIEYIQFLHDASEIIYREGPAKDAHYTTDTNSSASDTLALDLPIQRPNVLVPVIEIFLKDN